MHNFFPMKEEVEAPQEERRFTCPKCHHRLKHLDGTPRNQKNNQPNSVPNHQVSNPAHQNPQHYYLPYYTGYVVQPAGPSAGPVYGPPPLPHAQLGFPAPRPPPGNLPIVDEEDLKLSEEDWTEVYALYMQKVMEPVSMKSVSVSG